MRPLRRLLALVFLVALATSAGAETVGKPVSADSGPLGELSTNVLRGSGPVHDSVGPGSGNAGALSGKPVRGAVSGDMNSGPVSSITVGAVTADLPPIGTAVRQPVAAGFLDITRLPRGSNPQSGLNALQHVLRGVQPLPRNAVSPDEEPPAADLDVAADETSTEVNNPAGTQAQHFVPSTESSQPTPEEIPTDGAEKSVQAP